MPICPGCERTVPYTKLHLHLRHCDNLVDEAGDAGRTFERLERRLEVIEQLLESQLKDAVTTEFESRVRDSEQGRPR